MALTLTTFKRGLQNQLLTGWQDNQGVLLVVLSGGGRSPEVNATVARIWLLLSEMRCGARFGGVESRSNVADGPSRDDLVWMQRLGARYVEPEVLDWLIDPWLRCVSPWDI